MIILNKNTNFYKLLKSEHSFNEKKKITILKKNKKKVLIPLFAEIGHRMLIPI